MPRKLAAVGLLVVLLVAVAAVAVYRPVAVLGEGKAEPATEPVSKAGSDYRSVLLADVPHIRQKPDFCGEACAAMWLRRLGQPVDQDYVFDMSGLDPLLGRGCYTRELARALAAIGFRTGPVWTKIPADEAAKHLEAQWRSLHADLVAGVPSVVCMHYDDRASSSEHFRLVLGYDAKSDELIYHEPAETDGAYRRMKRATFLELWPLKYAEDQWTLIRMRLESGNLRRGKTADTFTAADYAQHVRELKKKIPSDEFTIVIQPPFVVIGDESPAMVRRRATGTVKWSVDKLKAAYFTKDPNHILDIWLFKDKESYGKHCWEVFRDRPTTPFGYYSDAERALIMNIATGGGTLVHEIVHPFVESNFPQCPAWFNEGLGSLYEQSWEVDGKIMGRTNWRLAGLQKAIGNKKVPSFETLCSTTSYEFYREDRGTNYAQARYLCYYLQEHGLLRKFYHQFHADQKQDPTGYKTLQAVLGRKDMDQFKKDWEAWVLKLRFP